MLLGGGVNCFPTVTPGVRRASILLSERATQPTEMPKASPYEVDTSSRRIFVVLKCKKYGRSCEISLQRANCTDLVQFVDRAQSHFRSIGLDALLGSTRV
eukprot:9479738-Pyramimonas_sp.AAC.1